MKMDLNHAFPSPIRAPASMAQPCTLFARCRPSLPMVISKTTGWPTMFCSCACRSNGSSDLKKKTSPCAVEQFRKPKPPK